MVTKAFAGKDTKKEELAEARSVRAGRTTPAQYAAKEKAEGEKGSKSALQSRGKQLASGKLSAQQYAGGQGMKSGGAVKRGKC